ncbi:hypothetical protein PInf_025388 [Phytophthora infestans]|nr:hypothetical protein PInf_025388 [Phytophthora infestans]
MFSKKHNDNVQCIYLVEDSDEAKKESKTNDLSGPGGRDAACASRSRSPAGDGSSSATSRGERSPAGGMVSPAAKRSQDQEKEPTLDGEQAEDTNGGTRRPKRHGKRKKSWSRERPVMRSVGRSGGGPTSEVLTQEETRNDAVNNVMEPDPKRYREAVRSKQS